MLIEFLLFLISKTEFFKVETSAPIGTELKQVRVRQEEKGFADDSLLTRCSLFSSIILLHVKGSV